MQNNRVVPASIRIQEAWRIRKLIKSGFRYHGSLFTLLWRPSQVNSRYAFIASRKVGSAVKRNRAVRLLREGVRRLTQTNELPIRIDGVLIAKPDLANTKLVVLLAELKKIGYNLREK